MKPLTVSSEAASDKQLLNMLSSDIHMLSSVLQIPSLKIAPNSSASCLSIR